MDESHAARAGEAVGPVDLFRSLAASHQADVRTIREHNRRSRLRWVLGLEAAVLAWLVLRLLSGNPVSPGWPQLGPDAVIYIFPVSMLVRMIGFRITM